MKVKKEWLIIGVMVILLLAGAGIILFTTQGNKVDKNMFAAQTDVEVFQSIPLMAGEKPAYSEARDVGSGNYLIDVDSTTLDEYNAYLKKLEENGFKKFTDNGEDGIEGQVYAAYYQKDKLTVHVCHMKNIEKTTITVCEKGKLSEHLIYDDSYVSGNKEGAKTKLYFQELYSIGNNFVFQLKNGNFIIEDGGPTTQTPYLLDLLDSLTPEGQKPIVEAWFITHSHLDHMGVFDTMSKDAKYCDRVYVENVYFSAPSEEAQMSSAGVYDSVKGSTLTTNAASVYLKSSDGSGPNVYRTRMGDRYYFNDFTIDIIFSQELTDYSDWKTWNSTSTVMMHNIEGQKVMFNGDTDIDEMRLLHRIFDGSYFDLDIYQVSHHGYNVVREIVNYYEKIDTLLYPTYAIPNAVAEGSFMARRVQLELLNKFAKEAYCWADGTKVLTFPYEVGTVETLAPIEWKYDSAEPKWKEKIVVGEENQND